MKYILTSLLLVITAVFHTGCSSENPREDAMIMSEMRQIGVARTQAISAGQEPDLSTMGETLSIDISKFETTESWTASEAGPNSVVLKTKDGMLVLMADGRVLKN